MSEAEDIKAQNITGGEDSNGDIEAASINGSSSERKRSRSKKFLIITSVMTLVFSMIALGFAIFSTITITQKEPHIEDLNVMANQLAVKMTEIIEENKNRSQIIESRMFDIRRLIQDNWEVFNQRRIPERMREVENDVDSTNVFLFDSTNPRMEAVEESLESMNSRLTNMSKRVRKLENPSRDRRQGGADPAIIINDSSTALALGGGLQQTLHIEDFKI